MLVSLCTARLCSPGCRRQRFAKSQSCDKRVTNVKQKRNELKKPCIRMIVETKSNQNKEEAKMKQIRTSFKTISVMCLLALTAGCSTTSSTQNKESMLVAS